MAYISSLLLTVGVAACGNSALFGEGVPSSSSAGTGGTMVGQGGSPVGSGGQGGASITSAATSTGGGTNAVTNFALPGSYSVHTTDEKLAVPGCGLFNEMTYDLFVPVGQASAPLVVLGHGFARDKEKMRAMAEHMASYGVRVVTPNYCHLSLADADYAQNVIDHVLLADTLANGAGVIHAGYSAGGTVAFMAATQYTNTLAVLGLDAVDNDGKAAAKAPYITVPTFGLEGEPSSCNQNNNGGVYLAKLAPQGWSVRVESAGHCDFESPSDFTCTNILCSAQDAIRVQLIRHLATAFVVWQAGLDPTGEDWVSAGGQRFQQFVAEGALSSL